jgi:hypothetical protein
MATTGLIREARELLTQLERVLPDDGPPEESELSSAELLARCDAKLAAYRAERAGQPHPMDGMSIAQKVDWLERTYLGHPPHRHR